MFRTVQQHAEHWAFSIWPDAPLFEHGETAQLDSPFMGNICHYGYILQDPSFSLLLNTTFLLSELLSQVVKNVTLHIETVYRKQNLDKWSRDATVFQITLTKQKNGFGRPISMDWKCGSVQQDSLLQIWLHATTVTQLLASVDSQSNPPGKCSQMGSESANPGLQPQGEVRTDLYCW